MGGKVAAVAIIALAAGVLFLIAKAEGVDFGSELSDLTEKFQSEVETAGVDLGLSSDPVSIALGIIKNFEGFSARAYADPPGQTRTYSIGYGHQIKTRRVVHLGE
jgi:hypothetical protein